MVFIGQNVDFLFIPVNISSLRLKNSQNFNYFIIQVKISSFIVNKFS